VKGVCVHRIQAVIARGRATAIDKAKSNQVYFVQWEAGEEVGSAWVQTKVQFDQVVAILRTKPGVRAKAETHLIPRDKGGLVGFLNLHSQGRAKPTAVIEIRND
jgi:hypothetical protein